VAVDINTLQIICHWKAVHNHISMLRTQALSSGQSMLGVADLHSGITIYDLCATSEGSTPPFSRLYHVDVDEVIIIINCYSNGSIRPHRCCLSANKIENIDLGLSLRMPNYDSKIASWFLRPQESTPQTAPSIGSAVLQGLQ